MRSACWRFWRAPVAIEPDVPGTAVRGTHPAFEGGFSLPDVPDGELELAWRNRGTTAELRVGFPDGSRRGWWRMNLDDGVEQWTLADTDVVP